jgi:hypothetical protein
VSSEKNAFDQLWNKRSDLDLHTPEPATHPDDLHANKHDEMQREEKIDRRGRILKNFFL